jgi:hypothetical protein
MLVRKAEETGVVEAPLAKAKYTIFPDYNKAMNVQPSYEPLDLGSQRPIPGTNGRTHACKVTIVSFTTITVYSGGLY